jgi:hypothetical protein
LLLLLMLLFLSSIPAGNLLFAFAVAFLAVILAGNLLFAFAVAFLAVILAGNLLFSHRSLERSGSPRIIRGCAAFKPQNP